MGFFKGQEEMVAIADNYNLIARWRADHNLTELGIIAFYLCSVLMLGLVLRVLNKTYSI